MSLDDRASALQCVSMVSSRGSPTNLDAFTERHSHAGRYIDGLASLLSASVDEPPLVSLTVTPASLRVVASIILPTPTDADAAIPLNASAAASPQSRAATPMAAMLSILANVSATTLTAAVGVSVASVEPVTVERRLLSPETTASAGVLRTAASAALETERSEATTTAFATIVLAVAAASAVLTSLALCYRNRRRRARAKASGSAGIRRGGGPRAERALVDPSSEPPTKADAMPRLAAPSPPPVSSPAPALAGWASFCGHSLGNTLSATVVGSVRRGAQGSSSTTAPSGSASEGQVNGAEPGGTSTFCGSVRGSTAGGASEARWRAAMAQLRLGWSSNRLPSPSALPPPTIQPSNDRDGGDVGRAHLDGTEHVDGPAMPRKSSSSAMGSTRISWASSGRLSGTSHAASSRHSGREQLPWHELTLRSPSIGSGSFGEVWICSHAASEYAVKRLRTEVVRSTSSLEALLNEYDIMRELRHPNVLLLVGIATDFADNVGLLTELLEASLLDVLHRPDLRPVTSWAGCLLAVATDIAKGMAYLHYHDVLHRDLKPANILLSEHWVAKVAGSPPCLRALRGPAHRFCPCLTLPLHADFDSGR